MQYNSELLWCIFQSFKYIHKVYRPLLKCSNLSMPYIRQGKGSWDTLHVAFSASLRGCMVEIRYASYFFQSILVKGNILTYISFLEKNNSPMKEYAPLRVFVNQCLGLTWWIKILESKHNLEHYMFYINLLDSLWLSYRWNIGHIYILTKRLVS